MCFSASIKRANKNMISRITGWISSYITVIHRLSLSCHPFGLPSSFCRCFSTYKPQHDDILSISAKISKTYGSWRKDGFVYFGTQWTLKTSRRPTFILETRVVPHTRCHDKRSSWKNGRCCLAAAGFQANLVRRFDHRRRPGFFYSCVRLITVP